MNRIKKGKGISDLTIPNCYCLFRIQYLLPCRYIFYKYLYKNVKLLTVNI